MRVLFVHPHSIYSEVPLGIMYLSAMLKKEGHQTALFSLNSCQSKQNETDATAIRHCFVDQIDDFAPDLVGFSVMSTAFDLSLQLASLAKERGHLTIFGGPHPTVDPEFTIEQPSVDMICLGEGEEALTELVASLENGQDVTRIQNIWFKRGKEIYRNLPRPLIHDLDVLPLPNRSLVDVGFLNPMSRGANFITGRGCPYTCSYCINEHLQKLNRGKGPFVRYREISSVIEEIKQVVDHYSPHSLIFSDEVFTLNKRRLLAFCDLYHKEIGLPFKCQTRADAIDGELAGALRQAGCDLVSVGIESGNERIRNSILSRKMDKETVIRAFRLLREAGLRTSTFNMIGMPDETEETILDTIEINRQVQPDHVHCTILMPFKGTKIRETFEKQGWLRKEPSDNYYFDVIQDLPTISQGKLVAYQRLFDLYVFSSRRYHFLVNILKLFWSLVPVKSRRVQHRVMRASVYQMTRMVRKLIVPTGKSGATT